MNVRVLRFSVLLVLLASASGQSNSRPYPPEEMLNRIHAEGIRAHMNYLADDLLEGRGTGTPGFMLAAKYVAARFEEMGLKPAGEKGTYFQSVRFRRVETVPQKCTLSVTREGKEQALAWEKDFVSDGNGLREDTSVTAPLVFVGYGVSAPEFHYDDYAGVDVRGKIVVELIGAPASLPSAPRAHYSDGATKARALAAHGAVGLIAISAGEYADRTPFERVVRFNREPNVRWPDAQGRPNDAVP